ncbi:MAG: hypothetical protein ACRCXE_03280 [Metamycoplasmataceae bacterium]
MGKIIKQTVYVSLKNSTQVKRLASDIVKYNVDKPHTLVNNDINRFTKVVNQTYNNLNALKRLERQRKNLKKDNLSIVGINKQIEVQRARLARSVRELSKNYRGRSLHTVKKSYYKPTGNPRGRPKKPINLLEQSIQDNKRQKKVVKRRINETTNKKKRYQEILRKRRERLIVEIERMEREKKKEIPGVNKPGCGMDIDQFKAIFFEHNVWGNAVAWVQSEKWHMRTLSKLGFDSLATFIHCLIRCINSGWKELLDLNQLKELNYIIQLYF